MMTTRQGMRSVGEIARQTAEILKPEAPAGPTPDEIDLIKRTVAQGASDENLQLYLHDCKRRGVHPLDRLIHFTQRSGRYTPVVGIDFMRSQASATGDYAGNDDAVFGGEGTGPYPVSASVTVWRMVHGERRPFSATARWAEYYPGDGGEGTMWRKMPHTMLAKCAEALALRKGFPAELSGLYSSDEMDQAGPTVTVASPDWTTSTSEQPAHPMDAQIVSATTPVDTDPGTGEFLPPGCIYVEAAWEKSTAKGTPYLSVKDHAGRWYSCWHQSLFPVLREAQEKRVLLQLTTETKTTANGREFTNIEIAAPYEEVPAPLGQTQEDGPPPDNTPPEDSIPF